MIGSRSPRDNKFYYILENNHFKSNQTVSFNIFMQFCFFFFIIPFKKSVKILTPKFLDWNSKWYCFYRKILYSQALKGHWLYNVYWEHVNKNKLKFHTLKNTWKWINHFAVIIHNLENIILMNKIKYYSFPIFKFQCFSSYLKLIGACKLKNLFLVQNKNVKKSGKLVFLVIISHI